MDKQQTADKELLVHDAVAKLTYFTRLYGIDTLFLVGGFCRGLYFDHLWEINDIDVASAYEDQAMELCGLFASEVIKAPPEFHKRSGAATVIYNTDQGAIRIDFQGRSVNEYMYNKDVREWMHSAGIEDVPLMHNIYGRDFTINSMIYSLASERLYDPTDKAVEDIDRKIIRSLLPAELLVKYNPLAILRAIRFSVAYDFHIEESLRVAMKGGGHLLPKTVTEERIISEIVRILKIKAVAGLEAIKEYGLDRYLMNPEFKNLLSVEVEE
jgi:tRNA nucleotidyltransferase/poly(A) polymerase